MPLTNAELSEKARDRYHRNKQIIDAYKIEHPCVECGEEDISCLEFHHRDPSEKLFIVSLRGKKTTIAKLKAEIEKCDVLCKNCHAKVHNGDIEERDLDTLISEITLKLSGKLEKLERRRLYRNRQKYISMAYVRDYKKDNSCKNCGEEDSNCLVFHHRDGVEKEGKIPQLYKYGIKKIMREVEKCNLLCHNCHSKIHH